MTAFHPSHATLGELAAHMESVFRAAPELRPDPRMHDYQLTYPPAIQLEQEAYARPPTPEEYVDLGVGSLTDAGYYFHFGFCRYRCAYCHHYEIAIRPKDDVVERHVAAMIAEARRHRELAPGLRPCVTFLGGGTPTAIPLPAIEAFLAGHLEVLGPPASALSTFEAKPVTASSEKLAAFRAAGFDRCSMGAQTLDPDLYAALHHGEAVGEVRAALERARAAGISWLNLDLMVGLEGETLGAVEKTLEETRALIAAGLLDSAFVYPYHDDPRSRTWSARERCPAWPAMAYGEARFRAMFDELGWVELGPRFFRSPMHIRKEVEELARLGVIPSYGETAWIGFGNSSYSVGDRATWLDDRALRTYADRALAGELPIGHFTRLDPAQQAARDVSFAVLYAPFVEWGRIGDKYGASTVERFVARFRRWAELGLGDVNDDWRTFTLGHTGRLVHQQMLPALYLESDRALFDQTLRRRASLGRMWKGY